MNAAQNDIRDYAFWKALTDIPSVEAIYSYEAQAHGMNIAVLCPEATSADWEKFMDIANSAEPHVEVTRLDALEPAAFRKELLETKSLAYYKPSNAYRQFIPDIVVLIEGGMKDLENLLAAPKPNDGEWLASALSHFHRIVYSTLRLLRRALLMTGLRVEPPVLILRQAMACGWMENRKLWEAMHEDWQYSAQSCTPPVAREILRNMPDYLAAIRAMLIRVNNVAAEAHA